MLNNMLICKIIRNSYYSITTTKKILIKKRTKELNRHFSKEDIQMGWVQLLVPVILALWEADVGGLPELRSLRPAWATR